MCSILSKKFVSISQDHIFLLMPWAFTRISQPPSPSGPVMVSTAFLTNSSSPASPARYMTLTPGTALASMRAAASFSFSSLREEMQTLQPFAE